MSNIFQGKRVRLRAGEPSEWALYWEADRADTDSARALYEIGFPRSRPIVPPPSIEAEPQKDDNFPFTIEVIDSGAVAGAIHIHHANPRCGTLMYGIGILPAHQHKGYAGEAIRLALRYYFDERRYQKCMAEVYSFNTASIRLHERLGFTLEARLRRTVYTGAAFYDTLVYGITDEEFRATSGL